MEEKDIDGTPTEEKGLNPIISLVILGVVILFVIKVFDWGFFKSEITAYPAMCSEKVALGSCSNPEFTLNRTTYKVLSDRQEVLYWSEVSGDVQRLTKCAVKDRKNWSCKYNDNSAEFGFTNGKYWSYTNESMSSDVGLEMDRKTYYLSRWGWLNLKCKSTSGLEKLLCLPVVVLFE